jgi:O-antigen/teichoic acid export membrane protein
VLFPISLLVLVPKFGVSGAAVAVLVSFSASAIPAFRTCIRMLDLRMSDLVPKLMPLVAASVLMGAAMQLTLRLHLSSAASLGVGILVGTTIYGVAIVLLARPLLRTVWVGLRPGPSRRAKRRWADVDGVETPGRAISRRREHL